MQENITEKSLRDPLSSNLNTWTRACLFVYVDVFPRKYVNDLNMEGKHFTV